VIEKEFSLKPIATGSGSALASLKRFNFIIDRKLYPQLQRAKQRRKGRIVSWYFKAYDIVNRFQL
jgi:hypothetical protein